MDLPRLALLVIDPQQLRVLSEDRLAGLAGLAPFLLTADERKGSRALGEGRAGRMKDPELGSQQSNECGDIGRRGRAHSAFDRAVTFYHLLADLRQHCAAAL
jgi:hypothetical protein